MMIYSNLCSNLASFQALLLPLQHSSVHRSFPIDKNNQPFHLSSSIFPLLHSRRRIRITLRPALHIRRRRSSTHTIPSTRLRPSMHLNRASRHPNTKQPTKHRVSNRTFHNFPNPTTRKKSPLQILTPTQSRGSASARSAPPQPRSPSRFPFP